MRGRELLLRSVQAALASGIGLLPEDRKRLGLVLSMNCRENTSLCHSFRALSNFGFVRQREERTLARAAMWIAFASRPPRWIHPSPA